MEQLQSTKSAFAAIRTDGTVVCWGDPDQGGDCRAVQDQLRNVQQIQSTKTAFAAVTAEGEIVTWGDPKNGGNSQSIQDLLFCV